MTDEQVADEHTDWFMGTFQTIISKVYRDALLHGIKHGRELEQEKLKRKMNVWVADSVQRVGAGEVKTENECVGGGFSSTGLDRKKKVVMGND